MSPAQLSVLLPALLRDRFRARRRPARLSPALLSPTLLALVASLCLWSAPLSAQHSDDGRGVWDDDTEGLSERTTAALIRQIDRDLYACYKLGEVYYFDCYRQTFRKAARSLNGQPDYRPAFDAMKLCETRVGAAVDANLDPTQPRQRAGFATYAAIRPEATGLLRRTTLAVVDEAETVLLRAPSPAQKPHFQKIAQALNSTKVLLRAAVLDLRLWLKRQI